MKKNKGDYLLLIFSIIETLSFVLWGGGDDKYYWFIHTDFYMDDIMNILTWYCGSIWKQFTGNNIILFNLLGWIFSVCAILYPYIVLQDTDGRKSNLRYLSFGLIFMGFWSYQMYEYDSTSMLSLSVLVTTAIRLDYKSKRTALLLGIIGAISIAFRLPNVLGVLLVAIYISIKCYINKNKIFSNVLLYLTIAAIVYSLIIIGFTGNYNVYNTITNAFDSIQSQLGESHGMVNLIKNYIKDLHTMIKWIPAMVIIPLSYNFLKPQIRDIKWIQYIFYAASIIVVWELCRFERFGWQLLFSAIIVLLLGYRCVSVKDPNKILKHLLLISALPICAAGSDTGLMKVFLLSACFAPLVFIEYKQLIEQSFYKGLLIMLMSCSLITNIHTLPTSINEEALTSTQEECKQLYYEYGKQGKVIFWGDLKAHRMYTELKMPLPYNSSFWPYPSNPIERDNYMRVIKTDNDMLFFDFTKSPEIKTLFESTGKKAIAETANIIVYGNTNH